MDFVVRLYAAFQSTSLNATPISILNSRSHMVRNDHPADVLQLSLTHFCELHGPKSILCTQVLPVQCDQCLATSSSLHSKSSSDSLSTQVHDPSTSQNWQAPLLQKQDTNNTLPTNFSAASTTIDSVPPSPTIDRSSTFGSSTASERPQKSFPYGRVESDTCSSCSLSVPNNVSEKLPNGAPGATNTDGLKPTGCPVLRSREMVCLGAQDSQISGSEAGSPPRSISRVASYNSSFHSAALDDGSCHDHLLTYLTSRSPDGQEHYSQLQKSAMRTLCCEFPPRGMSEGQLSFGDSVNGYTVAYVFRLPDPVARGRRRAYAFVALAGKDAGRAFRAAPLIWEAFQKMARVIEDAAHQHQAEQAVKEAKQEREASAHRDYTPVASFLIPRATDKDGNPRRSGQTSPRSLADIVGDENIFAVLHQYFVTIMRALGERLGGLPLKDGEGALIRSEFNEKGVKEREDCESDRSSPLKTKRASEKTLSINRPMQTQQYTLKNVGISAAKCSPVLPGPTHARHIIA